MILIKTLSLALAIFSLIQCEKKDVESESTSEVQESSWVITHEKEEMNLTDQKVEKYDISDKKQLSFCQSFIIVALAYKFLLKTKTTQVISLAWTKMKSALKKMIIKYRKKISL